MTLKTLCQGMSITNQYGAIRQSYDTLDDWQKHAHPYRVTLRYKRRSLTTDFFMGPANSSEPDVLSVLECLLSDAQAGAQSFEEFCRELGYDSDSRQAEKTHRACKRMHDKMQRFLGDEYETFLAADRN